MKEVVIKLSDSVYELITMEHPDSYTKETIGDYLFGLVRCTGKLLPKGHGNLIDVDAFIEKMKDSSKRQKYKEVLISDCLTVDDVFNAIIESLQNEGLANGDAPIILEADKENKRE